MFRKLMVLLAILVLITNAGILAHAEEDPYACAMEVVPSTLSAPGVVRVAINVVNNGAEAKEATLYDPQGNICTGFGAGGTANVGPGQSASFAGLWPVTQAQLDAGRVTYSLRYTATGTDGEKVPCTRPIGALLDYIVSAELQPLHILQDYHAVRSMSPGKKAIMHFTLTNTGDRTIESIVIEDPEVLQEPARHAPLLPGDSVEIAYAMVMGQTQVQSAPVATYTVAGDSAPIQVTLERTLFTPLSKVIVSLSAKPGPLSPGDEVELIYTVHNYMDVALRNVRITDDTLGDIDTGLTIPAGAFYRGTCWITVNQSATYHFAATGEDASGMAFTALSNGLTLHVSD